MLVNNNNQRFNPNHNKLIFELLLIPWRGNRGKSAFKNSCARGKIENIYIYIYIYTHTHIPTYTHTHIYIHTHTHIIYIHIYIYIYIFTYVYIHIHTQIRIWIIWIGLRKIKDFESEARIDARLRSIKKKFSKNLYKGEALKY